MSEVPPSFMIREEDEDAMDPDSRTENDGKRQHDAEFYRDDKVLTTYSFIELLTMYLGVHRHTKRYLYSHLTLLSNLGSTRKRREWTGGRRGQRRGCDGECSACCSANGH